MTSFPSLSFIVRMLLLSDADISRLICSFLSFITSALRSSSRSNTRLRDYINYVFTICDVQTREMVLNSLLRKPVIIQGKVLF